MKHLAVMCIEVDEERIGHGINGLQHTLTQAGFDWYDVTNLMDEMPDSLARIKVGLDEWWASK